MARILKLFHPYLELHAHHESQRRERHGRQNQAQAGWSSARASGARGSSPCPRGLPEGKGPVEGSHGDRAQGLHELDRLDQTSGDPQAPDRESLLDAGGREAAPLLLFHRVVPSVYSPCGYPEGKGSVEGADADRAQGIYSLDGLRQTAGGTSTPDRRSLRDAGGRKATPRHTAFESGFTKQVMRPNHHANPIHGSLFQKTGRIVFVGTSYWVTGCAGFPLWSSDIQPGVWVPLMIPRRGPSRRGGKIENRFALGKNYISIYLVDYTSIQHCLSFRK